MDKQKAAELLKKASKLLDEIVKKEREKKNGKKYTMDTQSWRSFR